MVLLGAFASLRPEALAELRRRSVDLDECSLRVTQASPELTNGRRVTGDPKFRAGERTIYLPDFLLPDLRRHLQWFAAKEPDGLLFTGERGAPFRRSTFGRKWRRARAKVGMPESFRFHDLRHTGNTLAADTGAKLKDLMVRAGQSSKRAGAAVADAGSMSGPGRGGAWRRPAPAGSHRMCFAGLVAALRRYSRGPRRKKRDQIAANTVAPRMNMSSGSQDCWVLVPAGRDSADCARKWPT